MQSDIITQYLEFHKKFGFDLPKNFTVPDEETCKVRLNFLLEELNEMAAALGYSAVVAKNENDEAEVKFEVDESLTVNEEDVIDGLIDLQYVLLGTAAFMGLLHDEDAEINMPTDFEYAFNTVHTANMEKERVERVDESTRGTLIDCKKPEGWTKPDLKYILKK